MIDSGSLSSPISFSSRAISHVRCIDRASSAASTRIITAFNTDKVVSADLSLSRPLLSCEHVTIGSLSQFEHGNAAKPVTGHLAAPASVLGASGYICRVFVYTLFFPCDLVQAKYVRGKETTCTRPTARSLYLSQRADYSCKKFCGNRKHGSRSIYQSPESSRYFPTNVRSSFAK